VRETRRRRRRGDRPELTIDRGLLVTRDLGNGYTQTQAGSRISPLAGDELARALAAEDADPPAAGAVHRVELTAAELEELEHPDPRLED
jgi:hypothetical protein